MTAVCGTAADLEAVRTRDAQDHNTGHATTGGLVTVIRAGQEAAIDHADRI
jgi:hypothetical protein